MSQPPQHALFEQGDPALCSVLVPVLNESENIAPVVSEMLEVLPAAGPFEILFVDDGSTDDTVAQLRAQALLHAAIRVIRLDARYGKSAALRAGVQAARGAWIATMDGDGQDDPRNVVAMLDLLRRSPAPRAIVAGIRARRLDSWSRRAASRFANGLRQRVLKDNCPDTGCGLKAFPREGYLRLPAFDGNHRYFPALFQARGHPLICHPVSNRPRLRGTSKYTNWGRGLVGIRDLLGVAWLKSRTRIPLRVTEE